MKRSFLSPIYIGIEKTPSGIRVAKCRNGICLDVCEVPFSNGIIYLNSIAKDPIIATNLPSSSILARSLHIPIKKKKDALAAAPFQLEPLLPYPLEEAIIDSQFTSSSQSGSLVTLFSVKKEWIGAYLNEWKNLNIDPEVVVSKCAALNAFATRFFPEQTSLWILHCELSEATLLYIEKSKVIAVKTCGNDLNEIYKTFLSISSSLKNRDGEKLLVLGSLTFSHHFLKEKMGLEVLSSTILPQELKSDIFCLSIGSALAASSSFNFRKKEFSYRLPFKRISSPLILFFASFLIAFSALFFLGNQLISSKKTDLEKQLDLLTAQKNIGKKGKLIEEKISLLEKALLSKSEPFPLCAQIPKVTDIFAWLSTLQTDDLQGVYIESFHYVLEKYPSLNQGSEKYIPKVELEIVSQNPGAAAAFHEELKNRNPFIDSKKELEWSLGKGKYKASFYLKDKTRYFG